MSWLNFFRFRNAPAQSIKHWLLTIHNRKIKYKVSQNNVVYCETIYIRWTFNFVYFVGMAIHELRFRTKYIFTLVILHIILNPQSLMSKNMSTVVKPRNFVPTKLNDFTVFVKVETNQYHHLPILEFLLASVWPLVEGDDLFKPLQQGGRDLWPWHWLEAKARQLLATGKWQIKTSGQFLNAPFRKISNSAQCGRLALILWRLVKGSFFCVF